MFTSHLAFPSFRMGKMLVPSSGRGRRRRRAEARCPLPFLPLLTGFRAAGLQQDAQGLIIRFSICSFL